MSYQSTKAELDKLFSKYIRKRDPKCCCCERPTEVCFHFIPRGHLATRWHESNCFGACADHNSLEQRTRTDPRWREIHVSIVGNIIREELESLSKCITKYSEADLLDLVDFYRRRLAK